MIECRPLGICSWNFELRCEEQVARLGFGWPTEQGWIEIDGRSCRVEKQGFLSGRWHLIDRGEARMTAEKRSVFTRGFELTTPSGALELAATSFASREMNLQGPGADAVITPAHAFTRRAIIQGRLPSFEVAAFSFWLTALTWRRAANNNAAAG